MQSNHTLLVVLLAVTAGILASLLVATLINPPAAQADTSVSGGDYVFGTGAYSTKRDLLYVINRRHEVLLVYGLDLNKKDLERIEAVDLRGAFGQEDERR
jgi:hypothetical protein